MNSIPIKIKLNKDNLDRFSELCSDTTITQVLNELMNEFIKTKNLRKKVLKNINRSKTLPI